MSSELCKNTSFSHSSIDLIGEASLSSLINEVKMNNSAINMSLCNIAPNHACLPLHRMKVDRDSNLYVTMTYAHKCLHSNVADLAAWLGDVPSTMNRVETITELDNRWHCDGLTLALEVDSVATAAGKF